MKRTLLFLLGLISAACTGALAGGILVGEPAQQPRPVAIRTCVAGATVQLADDAAPFTADAQGDVSVNVTGDAFNLHVNAPGLPQYDAVVTFTGPGPKQLLLGACVPVTDAALQMVLPSWVLADTGERGKVTVDGLRFVRADGSTFQWRGLTAFQLYLQWLQGGARAIDPVLVNWLTCCGSGASGPNVVRVLGMVDSFAHLWPQEHGARFYDELGPFVDHLWTAFHLRVEFVVFADAQIIMPGSSDQDRHLGQVVAVLASRPNVFLEVANEPFKNIPGGGMRAYELGRGVVGRGPPVASGSYELLEEPQLDYIVVHTSRDGEWPRKAKDLLDFRDAQHKPVVGDEPMGFGENPATRSTSVTDAAAFAGNCGLLSAGCTYHSDAGVAFGPFGPSQTQTATAFFRALSYFPADVQLAAYRRGGTEPGCHWAAGESLVEHDDARELRTFGKEWDGFGWFNQTRTNRVTATACPGWHVVEEILPGIGKVAR